MGRFNVELIMQGGNSRTVSGFCCRSAAQNYADSKLGKADVKTGKRIMEVAVTDIEGVVLRIKGVADGRTNSIR